MWLSTILITITLKAVISNNIEHESSIQNALKIQHNNTYQNQINLQMLFGDIIANSMRQFLPFSNDNYNCTRDGLLFMEGLNNQSIWSIQMYDSSSKYPEGIPAGEITELGNFDKCMSVSSKKFGIRGAYAVTILQFPDIKLIKPYELEMPKLHKKEKYTLPENILWALCFPDSCTKDDIELSVKQILIPTFDKHNVTINVTIPPLLYSSNKLSLNYTFEFLLIFTISIIAIALVICVTYHDLYTDSKMVNNNLFYKCLYSFSLKSNIKILTTDQNSNEYPIANVIKTFGIIAVIVGHSLALTLDTPALNLEFHERVVTELPYSILKSFIFVEVFFVLSGFFTYITIEERLRNGKRLKFIYLLSYRLIRILPVYTTVLLMFAFVLPYMGDGPFWKMINYQEAEFCKQNGWTNILFLNNYINTKNMCMLHSWYLACDMHFFIVGILLTYIIWKWRKCGIIIYGIVFVLSIYIPAKYIYDNKQLGIMPMNHSYIQGLRNKEHFNKIYIKSHFRISTYLIGLASGYIYLRLKKYEFKFSVKFRNIGYILCFFIHYSCYLATGYVYLPGITYDPFFHSMFFTFQRNIYSLTVSFFIVVSSLSNNDVFASVLKCKLFAFISKLSLTLYLTHFIVQLQNTGQIRQPQYGNLWTLYWSVNGDITTASYYSLFIYFIIELPTRIIYNHIMMILYNDKKCKLNSGVNEANNDQKLNDLTFTRQEYKENINNP